MSMDEYSASWKKTVDGGPGPILKRVIGIGLLVVLTVSIVGYIGGWFGEAAQVAKEEFGPRAMLKKYTWMKDAAAQLDNKVATLNRFQSKIDDMKSDYEDVKRKDWDRTDKQTYNQWKAEQDGLAASYNTLSAEFNSAMAQFHKQFANIGDPPAGATELLALPKEYKPYITE